MTHVPFAFVHMSRMCITQLIPAYNVWRYFAHTHSANTALSGSGYWLICVCVQGAFEADQHKLARARDVISRLKSEKASLAEQLTAAQDSLTVQQQQQQPTTSGGEAVALMAAPVVAATAGGSIEAPRFAASTKAGPGDDQLSSESCMLQQQIADLSQQLAAAQAQISESQMDLAEARALAQAASPAAAQHEQQQQLMQQYKSRAEEAEAAFGQLHEQAQHMEQQYLLQFQQLQQQCSALQAAAAAAALDQSHKAETLRVPENAELTGCGEITAVEGTSSEVALPASSSAASGLAGSGGANDAVAGSAEGSPARQGSAAAAAAVSAGSGSSRQGVTRRERAAAASSQPADAVAIDIEGGGVGSGGSAAVSGMDHGKGLTRALKTAWKSVTAAVQSAVTRHGKVYSEVADDEDSNTAEDDKQASAISLRPKDLQLGSLRPFGAYQTVRSAPPGVQGLLARIDGVWVGVMRFVNGSPGVRSGLLVYLLLVHLLVLWVRVSCHHEALAAASVAPAAIGGLTGAMKGAAGDVAKAAAAEQIAAGTPATGGAVGVGGL